MKKFVKCEVKFKLSHLWLDVYKVELLKCVTIFVEISIFMPDYYSHKTNLEEIWRLLYQTMPNIVPFIFLM